MLTPPRAPSTHTLTRQLRLPAALILLLTLLVTYGAATPRAAASTTVVVKPSALNGWGFAQEGSSGTGAGSLAAGPATPPLGSGSVHLTVANGGV